MSSPRPEHTLWVGTAGTGTAYGLCRSAREYFGTRVRIVAADINPSHLVAASAIADAFEQVPPASDLAFSAVLAAGLERHAVDTYAPILDSEIVIGAAMLADGRIPSSVMVLAPSADVAAACLDKLETGRRLAAAGLPSPQTQPVNSARWEPDGLLVKPRSGVGSVGVRTVKSEAEFNSLREDANLIAQEICFGPEVTIDTFRARNHDVFRAVCRERIEVKAGVCTKARVFEDDELESIAHRLCMALDLWGVICFQVMRRLDGSWAITDVNPRPGAGTRMSAAAGVDPLLASLLDVWGHDPAVAVPRLARERFVVRAYAEHVFDSP